MLLIFSIFEKTFLVSDSILGIHINPIGEISYLYSSGRQYNVILSSQVTVCHKSLGELNAISKEQLTTSLQHSVYFDVGVSTDYTGNSTVTLHNSPTLDADGLNLDRASSQYADLGTITIGGTLTFAVWCNVHSQGTWQRLFDFANGQDRQSIFISPTYSTTTIIRSALDDGFGVGDGLFVVSSSTDITLNTWMHVVLVLDETSNIVMLYVNGQLSNTTVPSELIAADSITGAKIADNAIDSEHYTDGSIDTAHLADDQVTLAKMAGLARGKIIIGDASGNPSALAIGSNGYVLKSDGTDIAWAADADTAALTTEQVQDIVGAMFSSNTETGITVTYQDGDGTVDLVVGTLNQDTTGSAATLTTARTIGGTSFDGSANIAVALAATATTLATARTIHGVSFDGSANIDLSEVVQDTVGAMFSSNTETGIAATYEDGDGTIDLVIGNDVIVNSMIADDAIDSAQLADGSIDTVHIAADQITGAKIADDAIDSEHYTDGSIDTAHIADDQITDAKLAHAITFVTSATAPAITATAAANVTQQAITSSSNAIAWDASTKSNAYHVTTENTTFSAPSNATEGAIISVEIAQGGTARTIAWNTVFEFAASTAPTITATANKTDILTFRYNGSVWQEVGRVQNLAQT